MTRISNWLNIICRMICKSSEHIITAYKWYTVLFIILMPFISYLSGYHFGETSKEQQDKKISNQLVKTMMDRNIRLMEEKNKKKLHFNLSGNWSYKTHNTRTKDINSGDVEMIQNSDDELKLINGYRREATDDTGKVKKINPPKDWESIWGQITSQGLKIEYVINTAEDEKNLGYIILNPPQPPFNELHGFYYIFSQNLITGDIAFMKQ
jgi:hypothetical protein